MICNQTIGNLQQTSQCQGEPHTQGGGSFYRALVGKGINGSESPLYYLTSNVINLTNR